MFSTACIGKLSENTEQQFIEKLAQGVFDDDREFVRSFLTEHKEVDANDFCLKDFKIRNDQKGHKVLRGWTLFHIAVFFKKRSMIKLLCELGADVNLCTKTEYKESPLALAAYTHTSARHTGVKTVKLLLKLKADINPKSEEYGKRSNWSPLLSSILGKNYDRARVLINAKADVTQLVDGKLPIVHAALNFPRGLEQLDLMFDKLLDEKDDDQLTAFEAARLGKLDVLETLALYEFSLDPDTGLGALHWASFRGHIHIVKYLVAANADICTKDKWKNAPLHWALTRNHKIIATYLIANNADVNTIGHTALTPLHIAASHGLEDLTDLLISKNADVNAKSALQTRTPLLGAIHGGFVEAAKMLIMSNANVTKAQTKFNNTPLISAAAQGNLELVKLLLEKNASLSSTNKNGYTALHNACWRDAKTNPDLVRFLLAANSDANAGNNHGQTPLALAMKFRHKNLVDVLKGHTHMNDTVSGDYVGGASSFNDYVEKTSGCEYSDDDSCSVNTDFSMATQHVPNFLSQHADGRARSRFITKLDIQRTQKYGHKTWDKTRGVKYIYKGTTVVAATDKPGARIFTTYKDEKLVGQQRTEVKEAASIQTPHREITRTPFGDSKPRERNLDARMASPAAASNRQVKLSPFGEAKPREENLKKRIGMHLYQPENG